MPRAAAAAAARELAAASGVAVRGSTPAAVCCRVRLPMSAVAPHAREGGGVSVRNASVLTVGACTAPRRDAEPSLSLCGHVAAVPRVTSRPPPLLSPKCPSQWRTQRKPRPAFAAALQDSL